MEAISDHRPVNRPSDRPSNRGSTGQADKYRGSIGEVEKVVWVMEGEMKRIEIQKALAQCRLVKNFF